MRPRQSGRHARRRGADLRGIAIDAKPIEIDNGDLQTRYLEMGDMAIRHACVPAGADMAPLLAGLPRDRCPSPHWGLVLEGSIRMEHADGSIER
jgi:hypothetical protein